jgi:ribonuclease D
MELPLIIRSTPELEEACARARAAGTVALDTEFVWMRTYRPRLGLVQIGTPSECWGLDCLQGLNPAALGELIADGSVVKILHDAHQDLEILWHYTGAKPQNVFDTRCAAGFAGFASTIGLQKLLQDAIGVGLAKTETCTDWTQRPLTDAQVRYALDDVRYLAELRKELVSRAEGLGTRDWQAEEQGKYDNPDWYADPDPQNAWLRIKTGRTRFEPRDFAVLRAVAAVREAAAQEWNLPRNWLGDDQSLVDMALKGRAGFFRHRLHGGQRDAISMRYDAAIKEARELPPEEYPSDPRQHYLREVTEAADAALEWLRTRAEEIHVDAPLIASRGTVTAFIDNPDDESNPLASGWRYDAVGREMLERFSV